MVVVLKPTDVALGDASSQEQYAAQAVSALPLRNAAGMLYQRHRSSVLG